METDPHQRPRWWNIGRPLDPTVIEGSRAQQLDAYRAVRDQLLERLRKRFLAPTASDT